MALLCPSVTRDSSVGSSQPAPCEEVVSGRLRPRAPAVVNQLSLDTGRRVIFMLICPDCIIDMLHLLYFFCLTIVFTLQTVLIILFWALSNENALQCLYPAGTNKC